MDNTSYKFALTSKTINQDPRLHIIVFTLIVINGFSQNQLQRSMSNYFYLSRHNPTTNLLTHELFNNDFHSKLL